MKKLMKIVLAIALLGVGSLIASEAAAGDQSIAYQGPFEKVVPILHPSVVQDLKDFEEYLMEMKDEKIRTFFIDTIIEVIQANPVRYSADFGSTQGLISEVHTDSLFWEKINRKRNELKSQKSE